MNLSQRLRKYLVMGSQDCSRDPFSILEEAIHAGITSFQFREKGEGSLSGGAKYELGKKLRDLCWEHEVLFIVNDDVYLFENLGADGIHVGQDDKGANLIRAEFPSTIIGLSVSTEEQLKASPVHLIDYLGAGPVFPTATKKDTNPVIGTEWIKKVKKTYPHLPLVGIGGIDEGNAHEVMDADADGVAVISAITRSNRIEDVVKRL